LETLTVELQDQETPGFNLIYIHKYGEYFFTDTTGTARCRIVHPIASGIVFIVI
jgi:hypothetical protein